jgi:predicted NBD/HSP70 family sugar kinase
MNDATRTLAALLQASTEASSRVLVTVLTDSPISRVDIARKLGLSQAAVTKAVKPLINLGLIDEASDTTRLGGPGRPAQPVAIVSDAMIVVGVKVTAEELIAVATDLTTNVLDALRRPLRDNSPSGAVDQIAEVVAELSARLGPAAAARIAGLGVTVSGDVDPTLGVVRDSALMGWRSVPLGRLLEERTDHPVSVHNDVHALTIAEHWFGVGRGTRSFAIVTVGRGIGAGIHVNAEVVEGAFGVVGELGHLPLTSPTNICGCGRRGCVEAVAASDAIARAVSANVGRVVSIDEAVEIARSGHQGSRDVFAEAGAVIGRAVASLVNLVGPEIVLLTGEGVNRIDLLRSPLLQAYEEHVFASAGTCRIVVREHTFDDWARGAATVAVRDLVTPAATIVAADSALGAWSRRALPRSRFV